MLRFIVILCLFAWTLVSPVHAKDGSPMLVNGKERAHVHKAGTTELNHVHLNVRDLTAAKEWLEKIWNVEPTYSDEKIATFHFNSFSLILDTDTEDSVATVGFKSNDCDAAYADVIARGAIALEPPANKSYGLRAAYVKGPGKLKFEIEGPLKK